MGNDVNTKPSVGKNKISIRWIEFSPTRTNEITAQKLKIEKEGYVPKVDNKVVTTYLIKSNNVWERCIKAGNKLKKIPGATIKSEEKIKNLTRRLIEKYNQQESLNR